MAGSHQNYSHHRAPEGEETDQRRNQESTNDNYSYTSPDLTKRKPPMLSPAKLQRLCNSPIANKLHIPSHDLPEPYVISIPFTLRMPPKLCSKTDDDACSLQFSGYQSLPSKQSSSSLEERHIQPPMLYFDGYNYALRDQQQSKQMHNQLPKENEFEDFIQKAPFKEQECVLGVTEQSDTLSVIDEVSLCDLRHASMRKMGLTTLPSLRIRGKQRGRNDAPGEFSSVDESYLNRSTVGNYPTSTPSALDLNTPNQAQVSLATKPEIFDSPKKSPGRRKPPPTNDLDDNPLTTSHRLNPFIDHTASQTQMIRPPVPPKSPSSKSTENELPALQTLLISSPIETHKETDTTDRASPTVLEADKTLELEELPIRPLKYTLPPLPSEKQLGNRQFSGTSETSEGSAYSQCSYNSLQSSVDLRLSPSRGSAFTKNSTLESLSELELEDDTEHLLSVDDATDALELNRRTSEKFNRGSGFSFSFPNNDLNVTNTAPAKSEFKASASRRQSFVLPNGQIEIPDCDAGWSAGTGGDEDMWSVPQKLTLHKKSMSTPTIYNFARVTPSRKQSSPVRHQRHKSVHNIVYNASPDSFEQNEKAPEHQPDEIRPTDFVVAEPPARVVYPVDFKEAEPRQHRASSASLLKSTGSAFYAGNDVTSLPLQPRNTGVAKLDGSSVSSNQSYGSFAGGKTSSSVSEVSNVMIDLTKENFDVCTISRADTVLSYKSVMEKDCSGKEVEVVLVDEDIETDRDELLSIYSNYNNDEWIRRRNSGAISGTAKRHIAHDTMPKSIQHVDYRGAQGPMTPMQSFSTQHTVQNVHGEQPRTLMPYQNPAYRQAPGNYGYYQSSGPVPRYTRNQAMHHNATRAARPWPQQQFMNAPVLPHMPVVPRPTAVRPNPTSRNDFMPGISKHSMAPTSRIYANIEQVTKPNHTRISMSPLKAPVLDNYDFSSYQ